MLRPLLAVSLVLMLAAGVRADAFVYFGTFAEGDGRGLYLSRLDGESGQLAEPRRVADVASPNFLALASDGRTLYAVTRSRDTNTGLAVFDRRLDTGQLALRAQYPSGGDGPCHVSVTPDGRAVLLANYGGGSVRAFAVDTNGALTAGPLVQHTGASVHPTRQQRAHAHCILPAPGGRFALACDLGLDQVLIYRLDAETGRLLPHEPAFAAVPPGSGPRQLAFHPSGKFVYVINELTCTLTAFDWEGAAGKLTARETISLLPAGVELTNSFSGAAIEMRPDGRFVYASLRGHDSLSVVALGPEGGPPRLIQNIPCGGRVPRGMGLDPSGRWLVVAHQRSDSVTVFAVDAKSGRLAPRGQPVHVPAPVDVKFAMPAP